MFDSRKEGKIEKEKVATILNTLGHTYDDQELESLLQSEDGEGNIYFFKLIITSTNKRLCSFFIVKFTTLFYYLSRSNLEKKIIVQECWDDEF